MGREIKLTDIYISTGWYVGGIYSGMQEGEWIKRLETYAGARIQDEVRVRTNKALGLDPNSQDDLESTGINEENYQITQNAILQMQIMLALKMKEPIKGLFPEIESEIPQDPDEWQKRFDELATQIPCNQDERIKLNELFISTGPKLPPLPKITPRNKEV